MAAPRRLPTGRRQAGAAAAASASVELLRRAASCAPPARRRRRARRSGPSRSRLCPLDCSTTDSVRAGSRPRPAASDIASAAPARLIAASRLLTSFVRAPSPMPVPTRKTPAASVRSRGCQRSKTASAHATIRLIVPARARAGPPDIGASIVTMPRSAKRAAQSSTSAAAIVGAQHDGRAGAVAAQAARPPASNSTARVCAASTTATITRRARREPGRLVDGTRAGGDRAGDVRAGAVSHTATGRPLSSSRSAIAPPMLPTPMNPITMGAARTSSAAPDSPGPAGGFSRWTSAGPGPGLATPWRCRRS